MTHRLSTIQNAARICALEKDEVIEQGTHAELCRKSFLAAEEPAGV